MAYVYSQLLLLFIVVGRRHAVVHILRREVAHALFFLHPLEPRRHPLERLRALAGGLRLWLPIIIIFRRGVTARRGHCARGALRGVERLWRGRVAGNLALRTCALARAAAWPHVSVPLGHRWWGLRMPRAVLVWRGGLRARGRLAHAVADGHYSVVSAAREKLGGEVAGLATAARRVGDARHWKTRERKERVLKCGGELHLRLRVGREGRYRTLASSISDFQRTTE
ncbi:hypothetical protein B0H10DRAFT_2012506 [Mycena sp. CBHHK59/15]|nr:hypothetical protein B0H10DRAFT_2012506 [Mycena sp. CBHHK59/15]